MGAVAETGSTPDGFDDGYLVRRAQEGYLDAYEQLVTRHGAGVFRLAYRLTADRLVAQDIAQDSFLAAYRALPRFRHDAAFRTWLYRIVTNRCLNHLQRNPATDPLEHDRGYADTAPGPAQDTIARAQRDAVRRAVDSLPPPQRIVIVLSEYERMSYQEIAAVTRTTVPAVRSQLFRARRALATALEAWR